MNSCQSLYQKHTMGKKPSDNSVGMDTKRKDLIASPKFKKVEEEFKQGSLRSSNGQVVNSPSQATAIAASESGQSYNQQQKNRAKADRFGMRNRGQK